MMTKKGVIKRIKKIRFDRKIEIFISITIVFSSLVVLGISMLILQHIVMQGSRNITESQVSTITNQLEEDFSDYKNLVLSIVLSNSIQNYLKTDKNEGLIEYYNKADLAKETLRSACLQNQKIIDIAIIDSSGENYLFHGNYGQNAKNFLEYYKKAKIFSYPIGWGQMKMDFDLPLTNFDKPTINLYYPIYSTVHIDKFLGTLCISIKNGELLQILDETNFSDYEVYLINGADKIIVGPKTENKDSFFDAIGIDGNSGEVKKGGITYLYRSIKGTDFHLIQKIYRFPLVSGLMQNFGFLAFAILLLIIINILISRKLVDLMYKPMKKVLSAMNRVENEKNLSQRIDYSDFGEDFSHIAQGFNSMMARVNNLVVQVKEEQKIKEKIKYNALQSQIKPHFLYNTLECIHWQALNDGNKKISKLVMALSTYYKICISHGHDIIPLKDELKHIESYLVIQNFRYDKKINLDLNVSDEFNEIMIPKLSLQPLIENALLHGNQEELNLNKSICVTAFIKDDKFVLQVKDNGGKVDDEVIVNINSFLDSPCNDFGYGIRNVHKRIKLAFGEDYGLKYMKNELEGVCVEVTLPFQKGELLDV